MDSMAKPSYSPKEILKTTIKNSQSKGLKEGRGEGMLCVCWGVTLKILIKSSTTSIDMNDNGN